MIKVEVDIIIQSPRQITFEFLSDVRNNIIWQPGLQECHVLTPGPIGIGSQYQQTAKFLGRDLASTYEIIGFEPYRLIKSLSLDDKFPTYITRIINGDQHYSHIKTVVEGTPSGVFEISHALLKWMVKQSIQKDYKLLKSTLETSPSKTLSFNTSF